MVHKEVIGVIPARWASSRFPGKPLVNIFGKSLIRRTYENALKSHLLDDLVVATDDQRIFNHVLEFGGRPFMTSESHINGTNRAHEVIEKHFPHCEIVVNIQGDEPCLNPAVIDMLIEKLKVTKDALITTPITKITNPNDIFLPSKVKCVFDKHGRALYFSRAPIPHAQNPKKSYDYYRHLGIYCFKREFLVQYRQLHESSLQMIEDLEQLKILEEGFPIHVCLVEDEEGIGVDTPEDLKRIEEILCHRENISLLQEELSPR